MHRQAMRRELPSGLRTGQDNRQPRCQSRVAARYPGTTGEKAGPSHLGDVHP